MPDQVESEPSRLSCEWHARECDDRAEEGAYFQAAEEDPVTAASYDDGIEEHRDRATKLRSIEALEAENRRLRLSLIDAKAIIRTADSAGSLLSLVRQENWERRKMEWLRDSGGPDGE